MSENLIVNHLRAIESQPLSILLPQLLRPSLPLCLNSISSLKVASSGAATCDTAAAPNLELVTAVPSGVSRIDRWAAINFGKR